jgi:DedD protein
MAHQEDTELVLSTGKVMGLFFLLVIICAFFFGWGYSLGKSVAPQPVTVAETAASPKALASGEKPAAVKNDAAEQPAATPGSDELTFYKSVDEKKPAPQLQTAKPQPVPVAAAPEVMRPDERPKGYVVQVAAVSKHQDAEALVNALRKKQYPVFIASNEPLDRLFHVQVGPFSDLKDAETMKGRLAGDGYNPIVKR